MGLQRLLAQLASVLNRGPTSMALVLVAGLALCGPASAASPCPAIGADSQCGIVITVTDTGASVAFTGQGPYDGSDDTLVGVINNGKIPISSLSLSSATDAFGFDGDGICSASITPHPAACPFGPTGYEGPGTFFTNISANMTSGTVNFTNPIPPGGTAYFSLEESLATATACSSIINGAVTKPASGGPNVVSKFTPNQGYTLAQAAQLCGFTAWNWQQTVTLDPCADVFAVGSNIPLRAPPPYNDPPLNGYSYQHPPNAVKLPVYYNLFTGASDPLSLAANETSTTLSFGDAPTDASCLSGKADGTGTKLGFTTHLVGIVGALPGAAVFDTGVGFSYTTTYNGTTGGVGNVRNSAAPADPGTGTGGITITVYNTTTTYKYPITVGVTAINGMPVTVNGSAAPVLLGSQNLNINSSGLAYSRATQTFTETLSITNTGSTLLAGPFQVVLDSLTPNVIVVNSSASFGGWPYITIPGASSLQPGESAAVTIVFKAPLTTPITFSPLPYSGSF